MQPNMKEIKCKQVGNNLILVINEKQYSKAIVDKEEREKIKNKVLLYNKRNSKVIEEHLIKYFDKTVGKKEEAKSKSKGLKKIIKKEVKKNTEKKSLVSEIAKIQKGDFSNKEISNSISKLKALLDKNKKVEVAKPVVSEPSRRRSGEY